MMTDKSHSPLELQDPHAWLEGRRLAAWTAYHAGKYVEALGSTLEALAFKPRATWPYYLCGMIYYRQGMYHYGAAFLKVFLYLERDKGTAYYRRAQLALDSWWNETHRDPVQEHPPIPLTSYTGSIPLSINVIVKNEEQYLPRLLKSIEPLKAQELVIVDTGSTDRTIEIAKSAGAKLVQVNWNDNFAEARNVALENSTQEWVCWFDADDELSPDGIDLLRSITMSKTPINYHYFRLAYGDTLSSQVRLWRRSTNNSWWPFIHERIWPNGPTQHHPEIVVWHYDDDRRPQKIERNIKMLSHAVEREPANQYWRFYLMVTLAISQRYVEAKQHAEIFMTLTSDTPDHYASRNYVRYLLAWIYLFCEPQDPKKTVELCLQGIAGTPTTAEFWCLLGDAYLYFNRALDGYACYDVAMKIGTWNWSRFWLTDITKYDKYPTYMKNRLREHLGSDNLDYYLFNEKFSDLPNSPVKPI